MTSPEVARGIANDDHEDVRTLLRFAEERCGIGALEKGVECVLRHIERIFGAKPLGTGDADQSPAQVTHERSDGVEVPQAASTAVRHSRSGTRADDGRRTAAGGGLNIGSPDDTSGAGAL